MARHLREQSGGDPTDHGPVPELANEPASPRATEDFPDKPEGNRSRRGRGDLSEEQLDDFAARLGLTDDAAAGDQSAEDDPSADQTTDSGDAERQPRDERERGAAFVVIRRMRPVARPVGRAMIVASRAVGGTGRWLRATGERFAGPGSS